MISLTLCVPTLSVDCTKSPSTTRLHSRGAEPYSTYITGQQTSTSCSLFNPTLSADLQVWWDPSYHILFYPLFFSCLMHGFRHCCQMRCVRKSSQRDEPIFKCSLSLVNKFMVSDLHGPASLQCMLMDSNGYFTKSPSLISVHQPVHCFQ